MKGFTPSSLGRAAKSHALYAPRRRGTGDLPAAARERCLQQTTIGGQGDGGRERERSKCRVCGEPCRMWVINGSPAARFEDDEMMLKALLRAVIVDDSNDAASMTTTTSQLHFFVKAQKFPK